MMIVTELPRLTDTESRHRKQCDLLVANSYLTSSDCRFIIDCDLRSVAHWLWRIDRRESGWLIVTDWLLLINCDSLVVISGPLCVPYLWQCMASNTQLLPSECDLPAGPVCDSLIVTQLWLSDYESAIVSLTATYWLRSLTVITFPSLSVSQSYWLWLADFNGLIGAYKLPFIDCEPLTVISSSPWWFAYCDSLIVTGMLWLTHSYWSIVVHWLWLIDDDLLIESSCW